MEKPTTKHTDLDPEMIVRIVELFNEKRWPLPGARPGAHQDAREAHCFRRFCEMLRQLGPSEQNLLLQLAEDFLYCPLGTYMGMLQHVLDQMPDDAFGDLPQVIFVPLLAPKDYGRTKSSQATVYHASTLSSAIRAFKGKKVIAAADPRELLGKFAERPRSGILLCDDFVGTGETAEGAIGEYRARFAKDTDQLAIVCLIAQKQGWERICTYAPMYSYVIRQRGISDSVAISDHNAAKRTMVQIEDRLGVSDDMRFGYRQSEALVAMARTPNNTFPVFWDTREVEGMSWPAPFPRYPK